MKLSVQTSALPSFITSVTSDLSTPSINARDLHKLVESKRRFSAWMESRLNNNYGFKEGVDYNLHVSDQVQIEGGRPVARTVTDYLMSPNMVKEIMMLEDNDIGKQVRQYYIQCEEKLKLAQQQMIQFLEIQNNMKEKLLQQPNRVVLKRNTITDLSYLLGVPEFKLNTVLFEARYCDIVGFPTIKAQGNFDCVDDEIRWSLPLIMKLLK